MTKPWEGKHFQEMLQVYKDDFKNEPSNENDSALAAALSMQSSLKEDWEEQQNKPKIYHEEWGGSLRAIIDGKPQNIAEHMNKQYAAKKSGLEKLSSDGLLNKVVQEISENHHKIIDDWCKAYMAELYEEGVQLKPGSFTLNEMVPTFHNSQNCLVKKYWFEQGIPQFNDKKKVESFTLSNENTAYISDNQSSKWQNIKTAPEDKTPILGYSTGGRIYIINFDGEWHNMPEVDFTHWMPLPKMPEDK